MYEKIAADTMMEKEPWRYNAYLKRLLQRVDEGALTPINMCLAMFSDIYLEELLEAPFGDNLRAF